MCTRAAVSAATEDPVCSRRPRWRGPSDTRAASGTGLATPLLSSGTARVFMSSGDLELVKVTKRYGTTDGGGRDRPARSRPSYLLLPARPVRLRQDLDAADDRRPRGRERGRHRCSAPERHRPAAGQARHRDDVPELRAVPAPRLHRQRRLLAEDAGRRQGDPPGARPWSCSRSSTWSATPSACRRSCPAASSSASRSPAR